MKLSLYGVETFVMLFTTLWFHSLIVWLSIDLLIFVRYKNMKLVAVLPQGKLWNLGLMNNV